jgi:hypothetical protein
MLIGLKNYQFQRAKHLIVQELFNQPWTYFLNP